MTSEAYDNTVGPGALGHSVAPRRKGLLSIALLLALGVGLQVATQIYADLFQHQPVLGQHLHGLYAPWSVVQWALKWGQRYPKALRHALELGLLAMGGSFLLFSLIGRALTKPPVVIHGSARWANRKDLERVGLLRSRSWFKSLLKKGMSAPGVYVGMWIDRRGNKEYLIDRSPSHVLGTGRTRSGKGIGFVLPTLLTWPSSCLVLDVKDELFPQTAGWRSKHAGNKVYRFSPGARTGTARWNPLNEVRLGTDYEVADAQGCMLMQADPDGQGLAGYHWRSTAWALGVGVMLHVLFKRDVEGAEASFDRMDAILSDPKRPIDSLWAEMSTYPHRDNQPHSAVVRAAQDQIKRDPKEATGVLSTLQTMLSIFRDPVVARNTNHSDFRLRDLMFADTPVTVYLVADFGDQDRLRPLVRLFIDMQLRVLTQELEVPPEEAPSGVWRKTLIAVRTAVGRLVGVHARTAPRKHPLLMMMDEFAMLGRIPRLEKAASLVAGYGIKLYLIAQDRNQLTSEKHGYGQHEMFTGNCANQWFLPPDKPETAAYISRLFGDTTLEHEQVTRSGYGYFTKKSRTTQYTKRPLIDPGEVRNMRANVVDGKKLVTPGAMLLSASGCPPVKSAEQPVFFLDPVLEQRAAVPPPQSGVAQ